MTRIAAVIIPKTTPKILKMTITIYNNTVAAVASSADRDAGR